MDYRLIVTGGTIDKQYDPLTGDLAFGDTYIPEMLARARLADNIVIEKLLMKESPDVTAADHEKIADACRASEESRIIVTHGTSAMVETARALKRASLPADQTIVLTGAMVPYSFGITSDAMFNLGTALAYCAIMPSGVYTAMHGIAFDPDDVRKDTQLGMFTLAD
jgi:L-asparaginase